MQQPATVVMLPQEWHTENRVYMVSRPVHICVKVNQWNVHTSDHSRKSTVNYDSYQPSVHFQQQFIIQAPPQIIFTKVRVVSA